MSGNSLEWIPNGLITQISNPLSPLLLPTFLGLYVNVGCIVVFVLSGHIARTLVDVTDNLVWRCGCLLPHLLGLQYTFYLHLGK